ncbi:MAG: GNAT family N-acetyltransferase [Oscillospiraceae bacterium]
MDRWQEAEHYVNQDRVFYANLCEILRRGSGDLLYAAPDGVLLYDRHSQVYMMSAQTPALADWMLAQLPPKLEILVGFEQSYREKAKAQFGFKTEEICVSVLYERENPPELSPFDGELCKLTKEHTQFVHQHYSCDFSMDYIARAIDEGMIGIFVEGRMAGFIGNHFEGTMGLLEVLPEYRRRGFGEVLERAEVRLLLSQGKLALAHVFADNEKSLALQRKIGLSVSEKTLFWIY